MVETLALVVSWFVEADVESLGIVLGAEFASVREIDIVAATDP